MCFIFVLIIIIIYIYRFRQQCAANQTQKVRKKILWHESLAQRMSPPLRSLNSIAASRPTQKTKFQL